MTAPVETASYLASLDCVHCGLCVQHCPTYLATGRETANPRGRIYLMRALLEGRIEPGPEVVEDLDLCLVCRACESVCPSGVRFAEVMADTRSRIHKRGFVRRRLMDLLADRRRLHRMAGFMRLWQGPLLHWIRVLLPPRLRRLEAYAPRIPPKAERAPLPGRTPAAERRQGTVGFLEGCVMSVLFQDVNRDAVRLLSAAGFDVVVPEERTCCGALHEHDGDVGGAHALLARNATAFADPAIEAIVMDSAGCGAMFRSGAALGTDDGRSLAHRTVDIARFLLERGERLRFRPCDDVVTYDAPCHLHHAQRETTAPLELLRRVPGLRLVPMPDAALCCGAAGIYNLDHPEMSRDLLSPKLDSLVRSGATLLLSGNPGCILQWRQGIAARGLQVQVLHPVTFLARRLAP